MPQATPKSLLTRTCCIRLCWLFAQSALLMTFGLGQPAWAELKTFELDAPAAKQVYLAGEMTNWDSAKQLMSKDKNGKWSATVDLGPGQWLYKFVVDRKWITDPGTTLNDNDGQGGRHSFVFMGDGAWTERAGIAKGQVQSQMVESKAWGKAMKMNVYLPPEYKKGQTYPVLLLLHGSGMDADQWLKTGQINRYMDNLLADKTIQPFVVVMPSSEQLNYTGKSETFITQELPVWLKNTYGLQPGPKAFGVAGMSMGGFGAFHLPSTHPDLFGFGFALSGYYPGTYINDLPQRRELPFKLMMLSGSEDGLVGTNRSIAAKLQAQGASFYYRENKGAHTFQYWSNRVVEMLTSANTFFNGGALPHNEKELDLPRADAAGKAIPIEGVELKPSAALAPRMLGLWQGEWLILPDGGIKGAYEENITEFDSSHYEGTFSVANAGPDTKFDEPFNVKAFMENGRTQFINPVDNGKVESVLSEKDGQLWRQWRIVNNGMDVLLRVKKIEKKQ